VSEELEPLPAFDVGLVLGCSPRVQGRDNAFFVARITAAAELFHAGKVRHLIVSGDNGSPNYDEPSAMKAALVSKGVPAQAITRDFAGFRTLDSVLRAHKVFGVQRLIVVSQRFHAERAVYLARAHGLNAFGFSAPDVNGARGDLIRVREIFSRLVAALDVHVLGTEPRFLGPQLSLETSS
jgi:SanA protein